MAKHLLLNVLVKVLGEFVDLNEENLSLAVWSGQIALTNVRLKTDKILRDFNLEVHHGTIQKLDITIPWATLRTNPVKISISGILLDVGPLDVAKLGKVEALRRYMADKLRKLKLVDQYLELTLSLDGDKEKGKDQTYLQQSQLYWTSKLVDNIEIKISSMHVRYEDSISIPGKVFAAGITLHSFSISARDASWGLAGNGDGGADSVNKLAHLECLGIYWKVDAASLGHMPMNEWEQVMMLYIVRPAEKSAFSEEGAEEGRPHQGALSDRREYILSPYQNSITVKLVHNKKPSASVPNYDMRAESSNLQVRLDSAQYVQLFSVVDRLQALGRLYKPKTYRPAERPWNSPTARAWWRYACQLAVKVRRYVGLVKLSLRLAAGREDPHSYLPLHAQVQARMLEEKLPFQPLRLARQRAYIEISEEERLKQRKEQQAQQAGWWGWGAEASPKTEEGDISIESILTALNQPDIQTSTEVVVTLWRVTLSSSSTAVVSSNLQPLLQINSSLSLSIEKQSSGTTCAVHLQDLLVLDRFSKNPPVPYIISVKSDLSYVQRTQRALTETQASKGKPTFSVAFQNLHGKSKLVISCLPLELCLNKGCIQMVLSVFARPVNRYAQRVRGRAKRVAPTPDTQWKNLRNVAQRNDDIEITFEASAPKIIIPENTEDSGYLLIDCGYLELKGFMGSAGLSLNVSLQKVTAGMPLTVRDMYKFGEKKLYLIKPFDIILQMQNIDQAAANAAVNVEILPELRGEIDSVKLARLLTALGQVTGIFERILAPPLPPLPPSPMPPASSSSSASTPDKRGGTDQALSPTGQGVDKGQTPQKMPTPAPRAPGSAQSERSWSAQSNDSHEYHTPVGRRGSPMRTAGTRSLDEAVTPLENPRAGTGGTGAPSRFSLGGAQVGEALQLSSPIFLLAESQGAQAMVSPDRQADPLINFLRVDFLLPALALDLTYDVASGHHLVLEMKNLRAQFGSRALDRSLTFELSEVSVQDSFRAEQQRDLVWTPPESGRLVHVAYTNMSSKRSPLYAGFATEIEIRFANLGLNVDVNTINHLRPFFEVLLSAREQSSAPPLTPPSRGSQADLQGMPSGMPSVSSIPDLGEEDPPEGMNVIATLERISLDLLRAPEKEHKGAYLENCFSAQVSLLSLHMTMHGLIRAEVKLRSFEITDIRNVSRGYVFKKIFCPAFETRETEEDSHFDDFLSESSGSDSDTPEMGVHTPEGGRSPAGGHRIDIPIPLEVENLLELVFTQQSGAHNHFDVVVANITAFIALDTILDLVGVAVANLCSVLALLAPPTRKDALTPTPELLVNVLKNQLFGEIKDGSKGTPLELCLQDSPTPRGGSTLSAMVTVRNPRLIFLEDPSSLESRAIVGSCGVEVHFSRDTSQVRGETSFSESVHVTLSRFEVFVLKRMTQWHPLPILEPIELELHLKRRVAGGATRLLRVQVEVDSVDAQVSFNDILLAQSILSRRLLNTQAQPKEPSPSGASTMKSPELERDKPEEGAGAGGLGGSGGSGGAVGGAVECLLEFHFGLGSTTAVVINDFSGQSIPIVRLAVANSHFSFESEGPRVKGDGSADAKVDFFNTRLSTWEPVMDTWQPTARIYSLDDAKILEVKSDFTMQLTVSGVILETLLRSYSQFFHDMDSPERSALCGIAVANNLGPLVGVHLFDSASKAPLLTLQGGEGGVISGLGGKIWSKNMNLPSAVDVQFIGRLQAERMPLFHLPLTINRPKAFNLQPLAHAEKANGTGAGTGAGTGTEAGAVIEAGGAVAGGARKAMRVYVIEPIVEEAYENSRYDMLLGRWRKPFMLGDPHEYTDASGTVKRDPASIEITSDKWEWQGRWEVDLDGVVNQEIDSEGWEYASTFNFFTMVSARRAAKAMDCVRRRRWTRTRIPRADVSSLAERPLTLFWDVHVLKNGARKVELRSCLQVTNKLSFPVMLSLQHNSWEGDVEVGPVEVGQVFSVPLLQSYATSLRIRPHFPLYEWSASFPCSTQSYDFRSSKNAHCAGAEVRPVWFRLLTQQRNKSVMISIAPFITITNKLLCDMQFACLTDIKAEEGAIESGTQRKLSYINMSHAPRLAIKVGLYDWSDPVPISTSSNTASLFQLNLPGKRAKKYEPTYMTLSMNLRISATHGIEIDIFSKVAVIDRTSLHLFVASKLRPGVSLVRTTCSVLRDPPSKASTTTTTTTTTSAVGTGAGVLAGVKEEESVWMDVEGTGSVGAGLAGMGIAPGSVGDLCDAVGSLASSSVSSPLPSSENLQVKQGEPLSREPSRGKGNGHRRDLTEFRGRENSFFSSPIFDSSYPQHRHRQSTTTVERSDLGAGGTGGEEALIRHIEVGSRNKYQLLRTTAGQCVYTDHAMRWCHLPPALLQQLQLRTPLDDRLQRSSRLVQFTAARDCLLLLLVDVTAPPPWLESEGFTAVEELATARSIVRGNLEELHFSIHGKAVEAGTHVALRASGSKRGTSMYSVFILPTAPPAERQSGKEGAKTEVAEAEREAEALAVRSFDSICRQLNFKHTYSRDLASRSWTEGANHMTLLYTYDNVISVGLKGKVWSREINIDPHKNTVSKGSFEVESPESNISYQLSFGLHSLPGLYSETQLVYFMPRYCILNCTEETLLVSQRGSEKFLQFEPYQPEGWHKLELDSGTEVQLRTSSTLWSLGSIDINDIGSSVIYVPYREGKRGQGEGGEKGSAGSNGIVLHVEVKLADPFDHCSIIVIVWQETIESRASMHLRNTSDVTVTIRQADIEMDHEILDQEHLWEMVLHPGESVPFGWADPESGNDVLVTVGEGLKGANKRIASINMLKTAQLLRLPYNSGRGNNEVVISVSTHNSGHVLEVSNMNLAKNLFMTGAALGSEPLDVMGEVDAHRPCVTYGFNFLLTTFGISLVVEKPTRREFLSLYVDWMEVLVRTRGTIRSLEFVVMDLQVDNYSESALYPVLLRSRKKEVRRSVALKDEGEGGEGMASFLLPNPHKPGKAHGEPFIKIAIVQDTPADGSQPVFKYVACRVLPVLIEVDSATMQLLFTDLLDDLKILTPSQTQALSSPDVWLSEFNRRQLYPQQQLRLVNVGRSKVQAQQSKMYFKSLIIHPVKVTFTFAQTTFPRRQHKETLQSTALNVFMSLVGVEKLQLRLRSFEVEDAMESLPSLLDLVASKSMQDVRSQLTQIAGSLTMLGMPIGFARKVGSGVKAFFYEPYQGAVHGGQDFFLGIGRGTSSLLTGVVSGAMDSAAAIVGTASKGISHLSGDADYVRRRALKRQQNRANHGGIFEGMRDGGECVISGISSGMTGLVSKPIEEASKHGFQGFFRGLSLGIIGAAVKPVLGLSDGITSVAQGISNQVDPHMKACHVRPPRALEPSAIDPSYLVITPLNMQAAFAQAFVLKRAKQNHYEDSFLRYIPLPTEGENIILSSVYVYWRRRGQLWGRVWANISHCVYLGDSVGIMLYSGGSDGGASLVVIPCLNAQTAKNVYSALAQNVARMGNPTIVIPADVVFQAHTGKGSTASAEGEHTLLQDGRKTAHSTQDALRLALDESLLGALDGYRFGSANGRVLRNITGSEEDVLLRAKHYLEKEIVSWKYVDEQIWQLLWEWGCVHSHLSACRCSVTVLINRSDSPIQITRVQLVLGRNVLIIGSSDTGYEVESRSLLPEGMVIVFICAFPESPLDIGHLKANINTAAFSAMVASTQRESFCEAKGGFTIGFLEKTVSEWWSKYVIIIS